MFFLPSAAKLLFGILFCIGIGIITPRPCCLLPPKKILGRAMSTTKASTTKLQLLLLTLQVGNAKRRGRNCICDCATEMVPAMARNVDMNMHTNTCTCTSMGAPFLLLFNESFVLLLLLFNILLFGILTIKDGNIIMWYLNYSTVQCNTVG